MTHTHLYVDQISLLAIIWSISINIIISIVLQSESYNE